MRFYHHSSFYLVDVISLRPILRKLYVFEHHVSFKIQGAWYILFYLLSSVMFYIFESEGRRDLDITSWQWEVTRLRCSIYQYHGTAQFQQASFGGQGGPGDLHLP